MDGLKVALTLFLLSGCAQLHHVQLGEIDNRPGFVKKPFDIKVSELGFNLEEAGRAAKFVNGRNKQGQKDIENIQQWIALFQMGPKTGNPVFVENYARDMGEKVRTACPSGQVTGLSSIRETNKYPIISGEIVRITGYCMTRKN